MKVSLKWLREFVECPPETAAISELLTMAGIEVEGVHVQGVSAQKVVVAQILESERHPNADRLSVCKVDDGSGSLLQIVCGAKNYQVGDKVPLAQAGAVLPGDFKIKAGKLRGVDSQGMMCSAKELGLAEDAEGLLILQPELRPGTPLAEVFPCDTIFDLEITPNRADLLSHEGIAREIAALTGRSAKSAHLFSPEQADPELIQIESGACPFTPYVPLRTSRFRQAQNGCGRASRRWGCGPSTMS
jgi:phenylalanyl-tRNA synthetase beta chain